MYNTKSNKKAVYGNQNNWASLYKILKELLDRRQALLPFVKEFDTIDAALQNYFTGVPDCRVGDYQVYGHQKKDKRWQVEIRKQG